MYSWAGKQSSPHGCGFCFESRQVRLCKAPQANWTCLICRQVSLESPASKMRVHILVKKQPPRIAVSTNEYQMLSLGDAVPFYACCIYDVCNPSCRDVTAAPDPCCPVAPNTNTERWAGTPTSTRAHGHSLNNRKRSLIASAVDCFFILLFKGSGHGFGPHWPRGAADGTGQPCVH